MIEPKTHIGFLIPEFPQQTHIAGWRIADAMRGFGHPVTLMSTIRPDRALRVHDVLNLRLLDDGVAVTCTLVGAGPNEGAIRDFIERNGMSEAVSLVGSQDTDAVARLLQASDLHLLTSFGAGEAAPAAVCEAMACGLPALCTRIGATPLMVEDGVDGFLVDQNSPDQIHERLSRLVADPALLVRMKRRALEKAPAFDCREIVRTILHRFGIWRPEEAPAQPAPATAATAAVPPMRQPV
jgi:glycosyltransferase involved in cell wall biosynthesis